MRAKKTLHGEIWTEPLSHRRVSPRFFEVLSECLNEAFGFVLAPASDVKLACYRAQNERYVILSNDRHTYYLPRVRCKHPVTAATALMKSRGYAVKLTGEGFTVRIPPRGVEIVKLVE